MKDFETHKEILHKEWSEDWEQEMPVTLITYDLGADGKEFDLHCQTGDHHRKAINKAKEILKQRGLYFSDKVFALGPSGAYYEVFYLN